MVFFTPVPRQAAAELTIYPSHIYLFCFIFQCNCILTCSVIHTSTSKCLIHCTVFTSLYAYSVLALLTGIPVTPFYYEKAHNTQQSLQFTKFTYNYSFSQSMLLFNHHKKGSRGVLVCTAGLHANCFLGCVLHPVNNYITAVFQAESSCLQLYSLTLLGTNTSTAKTNHNP